MAGGPGIEGGLAVGTSRVECRTMVAFWEVLRYPSWMGFALSNIRGI